MKKATVSSKGVRSLDLPIKRWLVAWRRVISGGNSLAVPWLGLGAFTARAQVRSPVGGSKIRQEAQCGKKKKKKRKEKE